MISGAFLAFTLPADPVWHTLYGEDLAAWSLPHVALLMMISVSAISGAAIVLSGYEKSANWAVFTQARWRDILIGLLLAAMLGDFVVVLAVEWYFTTDVVAGGFNPALMRPDWLLPAMFAIMATVIGGIVLRVTRRLGMATFIGVVALGIRFSVEQIIGSPYSGITPYAVIIPLLLTLDILYFVSSKRGYQPTMIIQAIIVTVVMATVGVFAFNTFFSFPNFGVGNIVPMVTAVFVMALTGTFMGNVIGNALSAVEPMQETEATPSRAFNGLAVDFAVYAGFIIFAAFLMITATPPV